MKKRLLIMRSAATKAAAKYSTSGRVNPNRKSVTLAWPSGEPVRGGDLAPGSILEFERATGLVVTPRDIKGREL
jgi:hypothetical protein